MSKLKGISISLAAKCQLLFGLAVLVIIAGALAVPWQRMEQLAKQPNIKAAGFAADLVFRQLHASARDASPPRIAAPATSPAATTRAGWNDASLGDVDYARPRVYLVTSPTGNLANVPWTGSRAPRDGQPGKDEPPDKIAKDALKTFRERPQEAGTGQVETYKDKSGENARVYRYAAAIRADASCIACHAEYAAWPVAPGFMPATTARSPTALTVAATSTAPATLATRTAEAAAMGPVVGVVRVDVPYQTDENQLLLNRIVIVVAGMLGGALAIVVFYLITSRLILQPVRVLKNTAEKVSMGDLNIRSAISTGDEFQHLSETFNTMLVNLKSSRDQLEATNRSLDTRVGELAQSNVDLFEANRLKSEFLTNVTHELRTPLNAIIGFADLMADAANRGNDPKQQRYSENIRTSARQLLELINDLLDLAKIEAGKLVLREEKVNVADACEAMANFMRPLAQKKNIALELAIDPEMPLITTDPGRLQQILYNFLSNAIKFTPNDGRVTISAHGEREPGASHDQAPVSIRIAVTDTGPGISAEDQKLIFEKFRQLDGTVTRQHSGTGLGLTISRELAGMLGGRIELASTLGKGATFSLIMPVAPRHHTLEIHPTLENA